MSGILSAIKAMCPIWPHRRTKPGQIASSRTGSCVLAPDSSSTRDESKQRAESPHLDGEERARSRGLADRLLVLGRIVRHPGHFRQFELRFDLNMR
jgi:hypothetical protein